MHAPPDLLLYILIAAQGAGALVIVGAGIARLTANNDVPDRDRAGLEEQMAHMRRVRLRNQRWAEREASGRVRG